jgi:hypothetical protein
LNRIKTSAGDFPDPHCEVIAVGNQIEHSVGEFDIDAYPGMLGQESPDDRSVRSP